MSTFAWGALESWFGARGYTLDGSEARRLEGGIANRNFVVRFDDRPAVLRCPPEGPLPPGANDMQREWRVLSRLHSGYPLAPRGLAFCDDESVVGVQCQVIEFRPGIAVGAELPGGAPEDAAFRITESLIGAMVRLHDTDAAEIGLGDLGRPEGFLDRQLESWQRRAAAVWPDEMPAGVERLSRALALRVPVTVDSSLLHMDLKFDNMLVDPVDYSALAVIDWDMATRGDPLFDLAVLLAYWIEPGDPEALRPLRRVPSLHAGFGSRAQLVQRYFAQTGRPEADLVWHVALARLRLAVIWMQLYHQWRRGALQGEHYSGFNTLALAILDFAEHNYSKGTL